jgi:hypothetical protein
MKRISLLTASVLSCLLLASVVLTARASDQRQVTQFSTPTPGPDGRIIYMVQEGDSCIRISLLTGVPIDQLRALNRLDENCTLTVGQPLVIGVGGPGGGTPTAGAAPTATSAPATPTPIPGSIDICVLLYDDQNGDSLHQETEPAIEGGAVSISGTSGQYSETATTIAGIDPVCFTKVPLGTYNISVAAPSGYNPTTALNYDGLEIKDGDVKVGEIQVGDRVYVDFGAQKSSQPQANDPAAGSSDNSLLGIIGAVLLLGGLGLAGYAWRVYGRRPKYMPPKSPPLPK